MRFIAKDSEVICLETSANKSMAATYINNIPQLAPINGVQMAPAANAGQPHNVENISRALNDVEMVKAWILSGKATQEHLGRVSERHSKICAEHIPGFGQTNAGLGTAVDNLTNTVNNLTEAVNNLTETVNNMNNNMNAQFAMMKAEQHNYRVKQTNHNIVKAWQASISDAELLLLAKERVGTGPSLPGNFPRLPVPEEPLPVGDIVVDRFPEDPDALAALTHTDIDYLSRVFNDSFQIIAGDGIAARRRKVRRFVAL